MKDLKQFALVLLLFAYGILVLIPTFAGCVSYAVSSKQWFYLVSGIILLGVNGYYLYKIGKPILFPEGKKEKEEDKKEDKK